MLLPGSADRVAPAHAPGPGPVRSSTELALALLAAATALPDPLDTDSAVPHAAPPPPRRPDSNRPDGSRPRAAGAPAARPPAPVPPATGTKPRPAASPGTAPAGVPTSWTGAAALLARTGDVRPGSAPPVNVSLLHATQATTARVDLSGMWAAPAQPHEATSLLELRRLDDEQRLMLLPMTTTGTGQSTGTTAGGAVRLPAQREHAVLTVFLPGATGAPSPGRCVAPLALAAGGRLTLGQNVCAELGLSPGTIVAVVLDPQRRTLSICAASLLNDAVRAGVDAARQAPVTPSRQDPRTAQNAAGAAAAGATVVPLRRPG